jgi:ABC-type multidrug transport system ATPase subunit/ABC-type multidrug transport system permease subunit
MNVQTKENQLVWKNLELTSISTNKKLLSDVNGSVGPSSMTALMGPSGAGKTTLLNALAGRLPSGLKLSGEILMNGQVRDKKSWPRIMGYVEQEFKTFEYQSVLETMTFADNVKLKLGDDKIVEIMNILGLFNVKDNYVVNLSGGERKRLSIAVELLGDPPILFLDEPTSGLDSFNALNILQLLKRLTEMGKTVLVTIHQPSYAMIEYFERIILLSQGGMIFDGTCDECLDFFEEAGYKLPMRTNPTDFFLDTISMDTRSSEGVEKSVSTINKIKKKWKDKKKEYPILITQDLNRGIEYKEDVDEEKRRASLINEENKFALSSFFSFFNSSVFFYLFQRNLTDYLRKKKYLLVKILQKLIFIFIFGFAYLRMGYTESDILSRRGSYVFLVLNNLFGVCAPIFNVFPQEKAAITRERRSGMYSGYTAFIAKFVAEIPINLIYELVYVVILYWIIGLNSNVGRFFITLIIIASLILFSIVFGLTISTISPAANIAQIIGSTFILLFTVYSGAFISTSTIPSWLRWLVFVSPAYYAFTALLQIQLNGTTFTQGGSTISGEEVIKQGNSTIIGTWYCIFLIWLYTLLWLVVGSVSFQYVTRNKVKLEKPKEVAEV